MSYNDLIRRGAALAAAKGFIGAETAITALPAVDPLADPRVQALVGALREIGKTYFADGSRLIHSDKQIINMVYIALAEIEGTNAP